MEVGGLSSCVVAVNFDARSELDVDEIDFDSELGSVVESRPELEVGRAKDSYVLSRTRRGEVMKGRHVEMNVNDGVLTILLRETREG